MKDSNQYVSSLNSGDGLTWEKNLENGSPPSREKAHVRRDTLARFPKADANAMMIMQVSIRVAAVLERVAW